MNLYGWQRIDRVIAGKPFGDGTDGDYNSSTIPTMTYRSCSGSASSTTLTLGSAGFSNGDLILIHQTRGTGAGQWEINKVVSGGGTTSLTLQTALQYTYTDSGASQAQAVKIPRYNNVTVPSGATWTVPSWNGDTGGILVFAAKGQVTVSGTINANGNSGQTWTKTTFGGGGAGVGFWGGNCKRTSDDITAFCGEGTSGGASQKTSANGNGGGGGGGINQVAGGGGGGHSSSGANGLYWSPAIGGSGGETAGSSDLINMTFGGGGGGGARDYDQSWNGGGGGGGGIVCLFSKGVSVNGYVSVNGGNGGNSGGADNGGGGGGGGAGGSILIVCSTSSLGSTLVTATGGSGGKKESGANSGGNGSSGRIALHYSGSYSGSTNPTLYANQDTTLVESAGGIFFHNFL